MAERTQNFDVFIERLKTQTTVYYDFKNMVLSIYEGTKTGKEMDDDSVNWLEINDRALFYLSEKIGLEAYEGINAVICLAAFGKDVVVRNFNPGSLLFWQEAQEKSEALATQNDVVCGTISFEESANPEEHSENMRLFLEKLVEDPKPTIIYHPMQGVFYIYIGENEENKLKDQNDESWLGMPDWVLPKIMGYSAGGYMDHTIILSSIGCDVEVLFRKDKEFDEADPLHVDGLREANQGFFPIDGLVGEISYHRYGEDEKDAN